MTVPDRSLKLLADRNISVSENEWYGIKLHDGMYEEANKPYFINYNPESALRTNLPYILHQADMMASKIEKDIMGDKKQVQKPKTNTSKVTKVMTEDEQKSLINVFDKLFK